MHRSPSGAGLQAVKLLRRKSISRSPSKERLVAEESSGKLQSRGDPGAIFKELRDTLGQCKDDLTPYGWRVYIAEFNERVSAERRLKALAARSTSRSGFYGEEDELAGLQVGTPLFQEKFDAMVHAEHLKDKILSAQSKFNEATDLMLKCHAYLAKDFLLSDLFVQAITYVPESQYDQVELVYKQIEQKKKELKELQDEYDTFVADTQRGRELALRRMADVSKAKSIREYIRLVFAEWNWQAQKEQVLRLQGEKVELVTEQHRLQGALMAKCAELEEKTALWAEEKTQLETELAKYKRLHEKQVLAAKQALEEVSRRKADGLGKDAQIEQLVNDRTALTASVAALEEDLDEKRHTIAKLQDDLADTRQHVAQLEAQLRETEAVLEDTRAEVKRLLDVEKDLREQLAGALEREAQLRVDLAFSKNETEESEARCAVLRLELATEQEARRGVEHNLAGVKSDLRQTEELVVETNKENARRVKEIEAKGVSDLEDLRRRLTEDFELKTVDIVEKNNMLEKEVALAEGIMPHLSILKPLPVDMSRVCSSCKKVLVFEGKAKLSS